MIASPPAISPPPRGGLRQRLFKNIRYVEYDVALGFFKGCNRILDVGCGTGTFLAHAPGRVVGIDGNPECVDVCRAKGLDVTVGNALDIPYPDDSFDGAYCSHVMHVFLPAQAFQLMTELARVVRPGGVIVIATAPFRKTLYFEPADVRPYPPQAIRAMFTKPDPSGVRAPTLHGLPPMRDEAIWFRRTPLVQFTGPRSDRAQSLANKLNHAQYSLFLRKYWAYDAYLIKIRNLKPSGSPREATR